MRTINYPDSMVDRNRYLEKTVNGMRETIGIQADEINRLKYNLSVFREASDTSEDNCVHRWQGDGYDYLRSIVGSRPILITASELRELIDNGEQFAESPTS